MNQKYRVHCIGRHIWETVNGFSHITERIQSCGWVGVRIDHIMCECYDIYRLYCRPLTPGPGCPRGINWPCPKCGGNVYGKEVIPRKKEK